MSVESPPQESSGADFLHKGHAAAPTGGSARSWALGAADLMRYHDLNSVVVRDDRGLFERVSLEAFQAGLSWLTVLRKRAALREVFCGFDMARVAAFTERDVQRLLADARIIRSRAKIEAVISNARAALALPEGLAEFVWRYAPESPPPAPKTAADVPASTPESAALARALKQRGFRFVGPTTVYAMMQAVGMVDDHLVDCHCRGAALPAGIPRNPQPERGAPAVGCPCRGCFFSARGWAILSFCRFPWDWRIRPKEIREQYPPKPPRAAENTTIIHVIFVTLLAGVGVVRVAYPVSLYCERPLHARSHRWRKR